MDRKTQRKNIKERENPILGERSKTVFIARTSYVHTGSRTGNNYCSSCVDWWGMMEPKDMDDKCPKCNGTIEYTNRYDSKTQRIIYECQSCGRTFVPVLRLVEVDE